jgi:hypothetical protein
MPLRQHDVVLADGRFRIILTDRRRLFALIDAPETALGPLRIALEIDRRPHGDLELDELPREHVVAGVIEDTGHTAVRGNGAFAAAANLATTLAPPAFNVIRDVAAQGTLLLAKQLPLLPEHQRKPIESAARIVLRARLGDLSARGFIERVVGAARSGAPEAQAMGNVLVAGSRLVTHALGPSLGHALADAHGDVSAFHAFDRMASAIQQGDFRSLQAMATDAARITAERASAGFDEYVRRFTPSDVDAELTPADEEMLRSSPRFVQPLARMGETTVGVSVGDVPAIAADVGSGDFAGAAEHLVGGNVAKGAAIGSAIGSVIPGVGTVIGGAVGAIVGGIGSLFGHHHGPMNFEHLPGDVGRKMVRKIADHIRQAPRWQAHFQAVYRHLPAGTADVKGLNDLVARELFPRDVAGKDATTGHTDGLAEWFAQQPDWEKLLHDPGVPPGDRHQLEARIHAVKSRLESARQVWSHLLNAAATGDTPVASMTVGLTPLAPPHPPRLALPSASPSSSDCSCTAPPGVRS